MIDRETAMELASDAGFGRMLPAEPGLPQTWVGADADKLQRFAAAGAEADKLKYVMSSFWTMLMECESTADNNNDPILKHWVECWRNQYARITGSEISPPRWIVRARGTGGAG